MKRFSAEATHTNRKTHTMNTYIKTPDGRYAAIRATRAEVSKLARVTSGLWVIVPASRTLREAARLNVDVKTMRILADGRVGYL